MKYKTHIKKLKRRARFALFRIIVIIFALTIGFASLFVPSYTSVLFFLIAIVCIVYSVYNFKKEKKEEKDSNHQPIALTSKDSLKFSAVNKIFESLSDDANTLALSKDEYFYRFEKNLKLRVVLYRTDNFDKNEFDNAKNRINKKANKQFNISQRISRAEARKAMRLNVIYTDVLNDGLYKYISQNAKRNLTRAEGIINVAIAENQIYVPPLYGACDLFEIGRYINIIQFIKETFDITEAL